jgi:uncharacterized protein YhdP
VNTTAVTSAPRSRPSPHRRSVGRRVLLVVLIALGLGIIIRLALPSILRSQINDRLSKIEGYDGHVDHVHVALWRGAYALRDVRIVRQHGSQTEPFFSAADIDFSLAWRRLIHGQIVADIRIEDARINFLKTATPETSQLQVDSSWQDVVKDIFPIDITKLEIVNGRIHYLDRTADPVVDVFVENLQFVGFGLRNRPAKTAEEFPAHLQLTGDSIGGGRLSVWADADILAAQPHFEVHGQIEKVNLPALNPFLKAYGGVQVESGEFKFYGEMAARGGRFEGYVKPFFVHMKFTDLTAPHQSLPERLWEAVASGLVKLFKNKPQDQLATRIPFSGEFGHTDVDTWKTITSMLHNGFIHALPATLEHSAKADAVPPAAGAPAPP